MYYLRYLCLFVHSGVQHKLCNLVYLMLPVLSIFVTAPSVFSNVYLQKTVEK